MGIHILIKRTVRDGADIAYCGAPYGANATYAAEKAYVPTLRLPGIVPHL